MAWNDAVSRKNDSSKLEKQTNMFEKFMIDAIVIYDAFSIMLSRWDQRKSWNPNRKDGRKWDESNRF